MTTVIRDVDLGLDRFMAQLRELDGAQLTVGVHADTGAERHPSGDTVAAVASALELGTEERPPLGWLRTTIDERGSTIGRSLADAGTRVLQGEEPAQALAPLATELALVARARVPVDTGTVRGAIEARVGGTRVA
jgi:hypothetical protein